MFPLDPPEDHRLDPGQVDRSETGLSSVARKPLSVQPDPKGRGSADLLSINYDVLPNIYAPKIVHGAAGGFTFVAFS